jgi:hypothetical protein
MMRANENENAPFSHEDRPVVARLKAIRIGHMDSGHWSEPAHSSVEAELRQNAGTIRHDADSAA